MGELRSYRAKRDFRESPEPAGDQPSSEATEETRRFVVQEHHARRLHWDFRLERDGVLVSWALPRGVPEDPRRNHLAVHVEDHPLDYGAFEGEIPKGNYGAGQVSIWDRGTYETHKWRIDGPKGEVMVTLHGERVSGRYVLFQTDARNWMIHRMDPPADPHRQPMPAEVKPMMAKLAAGVPQPDRGWAYEFKWDGVRAIVFSEGGTLRLISRTNEDITARYPEVRGIASALGSRSAILDGEIVALGPTGTPSFEQLQQRMGLRTPVDVRRKMNEVPVYYMAFDVLYLDGHVLTGLPYLERRQRLQDLRLAGPSWQTPDSHVGDGNTMLQASRNAGLEGVIAKRVDGVYEEGRRSGAWLKIKNHLRQSFVVGGWMQGEGRRRGYPGAVLVGHYQDGKLAYAGRVGTGFTDDMLTVLRGKLEPLQRADSPFEAGEPPPAKAHFVEPRLVVDVEFNDWTHSGHVRAGSFKGFRDDKDPDGIVREEAAP
jgi:bifunctional non-homologous end joining protein LigD